ncbi:MAG TPA: aldo/keto reductase [Thermoanaerobaculia bacterium]|jgi:aryl-alcohol dehydrogenase-like predicted oxidoreductase|nr:aldo/keto reductase [Thermoanaerobaculia bacterium]
MTHANHPEHHPTSPSRSREPITAAASGTFRLGGELTVCRLGLGAMRLTGDGIWGPPRDRAEALRALRRAPELGIDLIDTADSYGPHVSEELIAEALHPYPAGLVIATKGGFERPGPNQWVTNGRPEHLRRACEGSLRRLRLERIDLYQLHRLDPKVPAEDQLGTLAELRREGKVRLLGLSEVGPDEVKLARPFFPVAAVQNRYNMLDREWDEMVDLCAVEGIGFLPWFPLKTGQLAHHAALLKVAERHGATPAQLALAWLLRRSPVMLPIPGTSRVAHLEENVAAAGIRLDAQDLRELGGS